MVQLALFRIFDQGDVMRFHAAGQEGGDGVAFGRYDLFRADEIEHVFKELDGLGHARAIEQRMVETLRAHAMRLD